MTQLSLIILIGSSVMFLITIDLVRRKHLREKYSILWLVIFIAMILFSLSGHLIDRVAQYIGVGYPPSIIFIAGIFFLIMLMLMISVIVSHQTDRIISTNQSVALLEQRIKELEGLSGDKKNTSKNNQSSD
jgi:hypothetical protein